MTPAAGLGPVVAALAAAATVWSLHPVRGSGTDAVGRTGARRRWVWGVGLIPVVLLVGHGARPRLVVPLLVLAGVCVAVSRLTSARRRRAGRAEVRSRVLEMCEQLAADLATGAPPHLALSRAATDWPHLVPVAAAARIGRDVPTAWREAAELPGADDLVFVGAAWQVAHHAGDGLGEALGRVASDLRATAETRDLVSGELASARATTRLVAVLPAVALLMGAGSGGDPLGFLLATTPGLLCLIGGAALMLLGVGWVEMLAAEGER